MNQSIVINNNKIEKLESCYSFTYHRIKFNNKNYYIDISKENLIHEYISHLIQYVSIDSEFSLMTNELIIPGNKRLDIATNFAKVNKLNPNLRRKVGNRNNFKAKIYELKKSVITLPVLQDALLINEEEFIHEGSDISNEKLYASRYLEYAKENNYKLKELEIYFVAPIISQCAKNFCKYHNQTNNFLKIKCLSLKDLFILLWENLNDKYWFIQNETPSICKSSKTVNFLVHQGIANVL